MGIVATSAATNAQPNGNPPVASNRAAKSAELLTTYDANKNGELDPTEIEKIGRDRLLLHDRNKDGRVDSAELKIMRENSRQMPPQDELTRAMARERAVEDARIHKAKQIEAEKSSKQKSNPSPGDGK